MYALIDCNNFYASCERMFRPDLIGKPICVLSNNDGCVIARSNEAKALGIPMGAPEFHFDKFFKERGVEVFSANFALYGDMSNRVMNVLSDFSPEMEIYSIDETFLGMSGFDHYDLCKYGQLMRQKVERWTGIPISVGFAPTKSLAKVANRIAKKFPHHWNGVYCMSSEELRVKALKWLPIADVWGIGPAHAKRLVEQHKVRTAYDFTQLDDAWVRENMSVVGLRLKHDLMGKPTLQLDEVDDKKNIATTNYTDFENLRERIATFSVACGEKLRRQDSVCSSLSVFLLTNRFRNDLPQYNRTIGINLPFATDSSIVLVEYATYALEQIFKEGYHYKKAGVIIQDFTPKSERQLTLFENEDPRHQVLMKTMDRINRTYGQQKVRLAVQDQKRIWKMRQERLSSRYTTRLSEIMRVHA
jgi:DNA polymerase V